jgi:hypothetical protein
LPPPVSAQCQPAVTGGGQPPARWVAAQDAGRRVLTEASRRPVADRFTLCIYDAPYLRDVDISLRFKPVGGIMDRAGGIAVRVQNPNTYYVLRANAAEGNVRLYHVTGGARVQFAGRDGVAMAPAAWHTLRLRLVGDHFLAWFDGAPMFEARDLRINTTGRVALSTIADSQILFAAPTLAAAP